MNTLNQKLSYQFQNKHLLKDALRHRSAKGNNNERLEFLGDSVLNFIITAALYEKHPYAKEGALSRLRASLVKGETLANIAQEFDLGNYVELGPSELRSGAFTRKSILADTLEAIVGAIYLDGGIEACKECVLHWFFDRLNEPLNEQSQKDPKTRLQEYLQANQLSLPHYTILKIEGLAHHQIFHINCQVQNLDLTAEGSGPNRRMAEQQAATIFLELLQKKLQHDKRN